jgi:hypothetical protein
LYVHCCPAVEIRVSADANFVYVGWYHTMQYSFTTNNNRFHILL